MKIKTNLRAGKGGASGVGKNSKGTTEGVEVETPSTYVPPVSRCVGA
jgi:hypothetical protein